MTDTVLILGAKGRFGRAAATAFGAAGWHVRRFARNWTDPRPPAGPDPDEETVAGDAFDASAVTRAAEGADVIVNALNPPYPRWADDLPRITASVLRAAERTGATLLLPGNVYAYGREMPEVLTEAVPVRPTDRKGRLRAELEAAYRASPAPTIVLRGGDFIEGALGGNWFDGQIVAKLDRCRVLYPGPLDRVHAWAWLPDMARAAVGLAERRERLPAHAAYGFPGFALTGAELIAELETVEGRPLRRRSMPWPVIRALGLVNPLMREVAEVRYLWQVPHRIDGTALQAELGTVPQTPVRRALAEAVAGIRAARARQR